MFAWNIREREALMVDERVIDGVAVAVVVGDFVGTNFVSVAVGVSVARMVAVELGVRVAVPEREKDTKQEDHDTTFGGKCRTFKAKVRICAAKTKEMRNKKNRSNVT